MSSVCVHLDGMVIAYGVVVAAYGVCCLDCFVCGDIAVVFLFVLTAGLTTPWPNCNFCGWGGVGWGGVGWG